MEWRFAWKVEPLHRLAAVPLVLSDPLCPFGTSPHPVGSHPFQGRLSGTKRFEKRLPGGSLFGVRMSG